MFLALIFVVVLPASGVWLCTNSSSGNCGWNQTAEFPLVYPSNSQVYSNNADCVWTITAPAGYRIRARIARFFLHAPIYGEQGCRDYIKFKISGWTSVAYCTPPPPIESPGNAMTIGFHSDDEGAGEGITVEFEVFQGPINWMQCGHVELRPGDSVTIPSQFGSKVRMDCNWRVTAPVGLFVEANISAFAIWSNPTTLNPCTVDYLEVSPIGGDLARYCGDYRYSDRSLLERVISSSNKMDVKLHTVDYVGNFGGFQIKLGAIPAGSVVVQQILNLHDHFADDKHKIQANSVWKRDVRITLECESRRVRFHYGLVAQLFHSSNMNVNITIRTYHRKTVTFESEPAQSWIVMQDGIYKQDGGANLSATRSKMADFKWDEN